MMHQLNIASLTSDEAVNKARRELQISRGRYKNMLVLSVLFVVLGFAGCLASVFALHASFSYGLALAIAAAGGTASWWALEFDHRWFVANRALQSLIPLSETADKCKEALSLCIRSSAAQAIREKALASGRQLYVFDYDAMCAAAKQQENEMASVEHAALCRELHGLAA